ATRLVVPADQQEAELSRRRPLTTIQRTAFAATTKPPAKMRVTEAPRLAQADADDAPLPQPEEVGLEFLDNDDRVDDDPPDMKSDDESENEEAREESRQEARQQQESRASTPPVPHDPGARYPTGIDPVFRENTPDEPRPVAPLALNDLVGDMSYLDAGCEQMFCAHMWNCAGGRCQSRMDSWTRGLLRNYQVIHGGRCSHCGGIPSADFCGGAARPLCGPVFGSNCGVGLWREGTGDWSHSNAAGCTTSGCSACGGAGCSSQGGHGMHGCHVCRCGHNDIPEPWSMWDVLWGHRPCPPRVSISGWTSAGYHSRANGLFNDHPDRFNVHQSWLTLAREVQPLTNGYDYGYRFDVLYGADAQNTQAFSNSPGVWDYRNGFDHGVFGWALPQAYFEVATQNTSVIVGHFYTIMGYEVVAAPDNFFYSHSMTMVNSEPFTHTGVLTTWDSSEAVTWYGGWTLGWDTGFDQVSNGNSYLGGVKFRVFDFLSATYTTSFGDFGVRGTGYAHSLIFASNWGNHLSYVVQSDLLRVHDEDNVGVNQYLLYDVNDRVALGTRLEWWKADRVTGYAPYGSRLPDGGSFSYYGATFGANVRVASNVVIRPESRLDWSPSLNYSVGTGAVDLLVTY
ncbi:MAG: porin, partial [Planctomycetales bacterium]|nr:porin [Planctomycetales bacterium]